ncbi:methyl-accepting chemotaxis protein [uncultured Cohaesibacter sp.]|uniref:methyl-accepting chemotaxis protein n=1 Tax=uncultured Cohaesibacter sp. TaxID=1002546 RepID=UPI00292F067F|nr:methyl-accepting chemotaxis protein [uncultured Cohaesibacter sp.]
MKRHINSLSAKIIATVLTMVSLAFIADTFLNTSISNRVHEQTEVLTDKLHTIVAEKDSEIQKLLSGLLQSKENTQNLAHSLKAKQLSAETQHKQALLEGTRQGISLSVASLVRNAMMSGEASSALEQIDTLLENEQIAAINLWRTDGDLAFRDNRTIVDVNTFVEADVFEERDVEDRISIPEERKAVFLKALRTRSGKESIDSELKNDDGQTIPVTYSYLTLENSEDCQSCHDPKEASRGVLEVAIDSSELVALRKKSAALIEQLDQQVAAERAELIADSDKHKARVDQQTAQYTDQINQTSLDLNTTREEASLASLASKAFFFVATILLLIFALRYMVSLPLKRLVSDMLRLAKNDLSVEATKSKRKDEIGAMGQAISIFKENALEKEKLEAQAKENFLEQQQRQQLIDGLLQEFRSQIQVSLQTVSQSAERMQQSAGSLNQISSETSDRARSVNEASSHSADNVKTMAAASTEMTASIAEIGQQVVRTNNLVTAASSEAMETDTKVAGLASAAEKIGEVVSLIKDISEQTNLLALNATIEAARAGEAGRGFAVVAAEVKDLAAQTGKATEDIATRVQTIQDSTETSVHAIRSIANKMREISEYTTAISAAIQEQDASTNEISCNIQQAAEGTMEIESNIAEVASSTLQTKKSADEVEAASATVASVATDMRNVIDAFLNKVAAA